MLLFDLSVLTKAELILFKHIELGSQQPLEDVPQFESEDGL